MLRDQCLAKRRSRFRKPVFGLPLQELLDRKLGVLPRLGWDLRGQPHGTKEEKVGVETYCQVLRRCQHEGLAWRAVQTNQDALYIHHAASHLLTAAG